MKKLALWAAMVVFGTSSAQNTFEKGYIVKPSGDRVECLIKNLDWKNNPTSFTYKLSEGGEQLTGTLNDVTEFAIPEMFKFVRAEVDMDRSSSNLNSLSIQKAPIFQKETLFLEVLVEGQHTLYSYFENGLERFFYKNPQGIITQLVYKLYHPLSTELDPKAEEYISRSTSKRNNLYRNQLWNDVKCPNTKMSELEKLEYRKSSMIKYFETANNCDGTQVDKSSTVSKRALKKGIVRISPSVGFASYKIDIEGRSESGTFVPFGADFEYILPTNNQKLSFFIDPNYNSVSVSKPNTNAGVSVYNNSMEAKYNFLELPAGARYYFFLGQDSKLFVSGIFAVDITLSSSFKAPLIGEGEFGGTAFKFGLGLGYNYKDIAIEARAFSSHGLIDSRGSDSPDSNITKIGVSLRYNLL